MESTKQEKELNNSTAETFASLSIGLWGVSLIGYLTSGISWKTYLLVIIGAISALLSIYLILPWTWNWRQKSVLEFLETNKIMGSVKLLVWLVVIAIFATSLVQTKVGWLIVTGLITFIIALAVFCVGLSRTGKDNKSK